MSRGHLRVVPSSGYEPPAGRSGVEGDGGGPYDGGMEARVAKLEAAVEYIQRDIGAIKQDVRDIRSEARTDFRLLFGAIIVATLGLAGLMAKGFHWL